MSQIEISGSICPLHHPQEARCQAHKTARGQQPHIAAGLVGWIHRPAFSTTTRAPHSDHHRTPLFRMATMNGRQASLALQTRPQVRLIASARKLRRFLLGMNGSFKSSSHREMFYPLDVPFENCLSFGIVERRDRRADFIARAPKEGRRRPPPLPPERVNSIRHHQHRERVIRIPRDRETQKKEQPFANLLGPPILGISCVSLGARSCGSKQLGPLRCAVCARRRTACLLEHGESRSHGTRPFRRVSIGRCVMEGTVRQRTLD
jgi:hypothetical protein